MKRQMDIGARVMALIMMIVMAVTYMPILTGAAYAADEKDEVSEKITELPADEQKENKAKAVSELEDELGIEDEADDQGEEVKEAEAVSVPEADTETPKQSKRILSLKGKKLDVKGKGDWINVSGPNKSGYITVSAPQINNPSCEYEGIYISDEHPNEHPNVDPNMTKVVSLSGQNAFSIKLDMKNFNVGFHTVYVRINQNGALLGYDYVDYVPTYIYSRASNSLSWYNTGKTNFKCYYGGSTYYSYSGQYLDVFMDYRKAGGKWSKKVYGPISTSSYTVSKKTGLKTNSTYYVRMMYGKKFDYNGVNYVITGRQKGYASAAKKIKTAYKKPKVKKIKIKGTKTIVHKYRVHYANRIRYVKSTGRIISITPLYHTYKYYYTKYKVVVYMKKKMSIAGVQIKTKGGTVQKSGSKKKYVAKYRVSGKKKGKKIKVSVRCFRSKTYGGFSGWKSKKVKAK